MPRKVPVPPLTAEEIARSFERAGDKDVPRVLSPSQFAALVGLSTKTIYEWLARGRLEGAARKRGKHTLIWRDRALEILFSGKEWPSCPTKRPESPSETE
jgi:excisionase family DNA binding protein